ncbi:MAG TPA: hypothetical protein VM431_14675 [Phycisphaerae bacterium]|nr:hypothetical protein [Phycisphaerae bacterium]
MSWNETVLEYLKVILAWPLLGSAGILLIVWCLRKPLDHLLRNISVRTPSGFEIQAQQPKPEPIEKEEPGTVKLDPQQLEELSAFVDGLQNQLNLTTKQKEDLRNSARQEIEKAWSASRYWEFMYLDRFLVPHTKQVLWYFHSQQGQITREYFSLLWPGFNFGSENEREAVLNALQTNGLVTQMGNILSVTDKGRSFLIFIGSIPS